MPPDFCHVQSVMPPAQKSDAAVQEFAARSRRQTLSEEAHSKEPQDLTSRARLSCSQAYAIGQSAWAPARKSMQLCKTSLRVHVVRLFSGDALVTSYGIITSNTQWSRPRAKPVVISLNAYLLQALRRIPRTQRVKGISNAEVTPGTKDTKGSLGNKERYIMGWRNP